MADTTLKFKRGQESKVNSLAKEDGSVIFGLGSSGAPSTLHFDSTNGSSVQRLGVAVASASSANTASTATKLRTARKINDASFDGTKDVDITELHPVVITDQSVDLNTLRLTGDFLGRKLYLCGTDGGSSKITHKPETANEGFVLLVEQLRWYDDSTDYTNKQTLEYRTSHKVYIRYSDGTTWGNWILQSDDGIASTANYSKNSGALGGSSLSQVLASAGGGSAFVGLDTTTNNVVKLTRANGGTVQKTINNVSHATSASIATTANIAKALPATVTLGNGNGAMIDQNGSNYRQRIRIEDNASANDNVFVFQQSVNAGSTYTDLFRILDNGTVVANTFTGALNGTANYAKNSGQLQGHTLTTVTTGTSATFANHIPYISGSALEISRYIDFHGDGTSRDYSVRLDTGTPSKLIVSGPSASTVQAGYFQGVAQNSNALGGSSLSQVLSYASSRVSSSSYLNNYFTSRQTSANVAINGKGGLRTFKATSTMTTGKPTIGDSHILHFDWDNTGGFDSQLAIGPHNPPHMQMRSQESGTWGAWTDILDQNNYTKYIPLRTKTINAGFSTAFRTQTQGSTAQGSFLSMIRNNTASVTNSPQFGSGIAWGHSDTHGYLYTNYSSAHAYIGGGNANKLNWVKELVFTDTKISNASTADHAKNSAALGGSSLSQILASAGGGKYLPLAGGTMTGTLNFSNGVGITGTMASSDQWRIIGGGTSDSGYLEIATKDNANEPIYVRQYTAFTSTGLKRTATLLDGNGNTSFPGIVTASTFRGNIERGGIGTSWIDSGKGKAALVRKTTSAGYDPIVYAKASTGSWVWATYNQDALYLTYFNSSVLAGTANTFTKQFILNPNGDLAGLRNVTASTFSGYLNGNAKTASSASSATLASSASRLTPMTTLTGGNGNTTGYRLIATIGLSQWSNYRGVFAVKSRHTGAGLLSISVGCNAATVNSANAYAEIKYWGPTSSGSIINSNSWQVYISSDGRKAYIFWQYSDGNTCPIIPLSTDFTVSNGTWMTSISTATYGARKTGTSINYASDSAALGGSSLSQILAQAGSGNAFTGLDTATNNVIKLTRANGGTVQKTINNVANATSASIASTAKVANKIGSATVGSATKPIYLNAGTPTQLTSITSSFAAAPQDLNNTDLNTVRSPGEYFGGGGNGCANKPSGVDAFALEVRRAADGWYVQIMYASNNQQKTYIRYYNGSSWTGWVTDSTSSGNNAYNSVTVSNATLKFGRLNGATGTTVTVNNVANATSAANANLLDGIDSSRFIYGSGAHGVNSSYSNASSIWKSGFYDLSTTGGSASGLPTTNAWHWLIEAGHRSNSSTYRYGLQIAAPNDTGNNLYYRINPQSGNGTWRTIIDNHNYTNYAADRTAFTVLDTTTNNVIRLTRANGVTVQKTINNVAHSTSASVATTATRLNTFKNLLSTSTDTTKNWKPYGNSVVLYNSSRLINQPQSWGLVANFTGDDEVHQIFMDQPSGSLYHRSGNASGWWKSWTEILDTSNLATYTTKFVTKDELGSGSSTGSINVDAARRIVNSTVNTRNAQSFRVGTPGSGSWTGFPSSYLYSASSTAALKTNAYYRNQVGVLHVAAGTAYHDLVFADAGTDNGIVRVSSKGDTGLILDTTNYATYSTRYNALSSSTLTVTTAGGVNIDGGSY